MAQALARQDGGRARDWLAYVHEIESLGKQRLEEKKRQQRLRTRNESESSRRPVTPAGEITAALEEQTQGPDYSDLLAGFLGDRQEGVR